MEPETEPEGHTEGEALSLRDAEDTELSISARMLRAGLARLTKGNAAAAVLRPHMEEARAARRGIYEMGDPDSDGEGERRFGGR